MCQAIKEYYEQTGNKVGFKPAGGINTVNDALIYYTIVKEVLGKEWLSNELFRLGTSRLANLLLSEIKGEELKFFTKATLAIKYVMPCRPLYSCGVTRYFFLRKTKVSYREVRRFFYLCADISPQRIG